MLRKVVSSSLILSQLFATAAYAQTTDPAFYYRHNAQVVVDGSVDNPEEPPVETGPFAARVNGGTFRAMILAYDDAGMSISLYVPATGRPFYDAVSWELVSGKLPAGVTAKLSDEGDTMVFSGIATEAGEFGSLVFKVRDKDGNEILTPGISLMVINSEIYLYTQFGETQTLKARTDSASLSIGVANVRPSDPLTEDNFEIMGVIPAGITYTTTGNSLRFSGVPDVAGTYDDIVVKVTDRFGRTDSMTVGFDVTSHYRAVNNKNTEYLDENLDAPTLITTLEKVGTGGVYRDGATWTLASGRLPAGVTATPSSDGSQMVYSGVPTEAGTFRITWLVDDGHGNMVMTSPVRLYVGVVPDLEVVSNRGNSITLDTTSNRRTMFTADNSFEQRGIPAGNWKVSGTLPKGLTFTQTGSVGYLTGVPETPGVYPITLTATDTAGKTDDLAVTLRVNNGVELAQAGTLSASLYAGLQSYDGSNKLLLKNGGSAYKNDNTKWEMISGKLPTGIVATVSSDKSTLTYTGMPTETGTFRNIVWRATDGFGNTYETRPLSLVVSTKEALELVREGSDRDPQTVSGLPYDPRYISVRAYNAAPGGISSSNWEVTGVPEGMTFTTSGGSVVIRGVPRRTGQYVVKVKAVDRLGDEASIDLPINVVNGLSAAHYNATSETINQYGYKPRTVLVALLTVANAPYWGGNVTWQHIRGTLPPGVTLAPSGDGAYMYFEGSATTEGVYDNIVFRVTDVNGNTFETKPFTFTVEAMKGELEIAGDFTQAETSVGDSFNASVRAVNLPAPDNLTASNWKISGLPDGITSSFSGNGKILYLSGRATKAGSYSANFEVTDRFGRKAAYSMDITVTAGFQLVALDSSGRDNGPQFLTRYSTLVDRTMVIQNIETGELYTDGATWNAVELNLPEGVQANLASDSSAMLLTGYSIEATGSSALRRTRWNVTLANGKTISGHADFYLNENAMSISGGNNASPIVGKPFSQEYTVNNFGAISALNLGHVTATNLPEGLKLRVDGSKILVEGSPEKAGEYKLALNVRDEFGRSANITRTINVIEPIRVGYNRRSTTTNRYTSNLDQVTLLVYNNENGTYWDGPLTYTLETGSLPKGLSMVQSYDPGYGAVTGYAEELGTFKSTWRITTAEGVSIVSPEIEIIVSEGVAPTISGTAQATVTVNTQSTLGTFSLRNPAFNQPVKSNDWVVTNIPSGMTASVVDGVLTISGVPTQFGSYELGIQVTDAAGRVATYSRTVEVGAAFQASRNNPIYGTAYTQDMNQGMVWTIITGNSSVLYEATDVEWTLETGSLPAGLRLEKNPTERNSLSLRGYPTQAGDYRSTWRATAPDGSYAITPEILVRIYSRTALSISGSAPSSVIVGNPSNLGTYSARNTAFGQPLTSDDWTVTGLPPGMGKAVVDGVLTLTGTPTAPGTYSLSITAKDSGGGTATYSRSVEVRPAFEAKTNTTFSGAALTSDFNRGFVWAVNTVNNSLVEDVDLVWTKESGTFPDGLRLEPSSSERNSLVLRGYAERAGTYRSVWRATAPNGTYALTPEITITVGSRTALTVSGGTNLTVAPGLNGSLGTFTASGFAYGQPIEDDKWTVTNLPPGFDAQVVNGTLRISGTASQTETTYNVIVRATDASGTSASKTVTVTVKAPFRIVPNYSTITATVGKVYGPRTYLLFWDDNNNYMTTARNLTLESGSLPPGMTLVQGTSGDARGTGILGGTPTAPGEYRSRWKVTSSSGVVVYQKFDTVITVN